MRLEVRISCSLKTVAAHPGLVRDANLPTGAHKRPVARQMNGVLESARGEAKRQREAIAALEGKLRAARSALLAAETRITQLTLLPVPLPPLPLSQLLSEVSFTSHRAGCSTLQPN